MMSSRRNPGGAWAVVVLVCVALVPGWAWAAAGSPPKEPIETVASNGQSIPEDTFHFAIGGGELTTRIRREGVDVARRLLASGGFDPKAPLFGKAQMNALGRELTFEGRLDDAAVVLELLVVAYPDFWRGHEALGDAHRLRGEPEKARQYYQRTLELMSGNVYAREQLEALSE